MAMTIAEKILARAAGLDSVRSGEYVTARADTIVMCDLAWFLAGPAIEDLGVKVVEPDRVMVAFDHKVPAETVEAATLHKRWRAFCAEHRITHIHDIGDHGISHVVSVERGYARPGTLQANIDTHANTCGAVGCFAVALGRDIVADLVLGQNWYQVPETIRVHLSGELAPGVMVRDVAQHVIGEIGQDGAAGLVMEFVGPLVDAMTIEERMTLCNWSRKVEAVTGIVNPDQRAIDYVHARTDAPFAPLLSDPEAWYRAEYSFDAGAIGPLVAAPPAPVNTKTVSALQGKRVHQAFVGSCAGGHLEDIRAAADMLRGRKVHRDVRMIVTPASQAIWRQAEREGLWALLSEAGALVTSSTCGACYGGISGVLAPGEVCISTSTENFAGRMGSLEAEVLLASPLTVAASAITGVVTDPRAMIGEL
jgi:3-isopropylmalate/(R)-2-methylmalate dehydratase large subunit